MATTKKPKRRPTLNPRPCRASERVVLGMPIDVDTLLRPIIATLLQETFWVIALDVRNRVIDKVEVARGSLTGVEVHPREVFRPAIELAAAGIVVCHNHPSGDPTPSAEDVVLTRRLKECGDLIGIPVIDHVVIGEEGYRSISEWMGEWMGTAL